MQSQQRPHQRQPVVQAPRQLHRCSIYQELTPCKLCALSICGVSPRLLYSCSASSTLPGSQSNIDRLGWLLVNEGPRRTVIEGGIIALDGSPMAVTRTIISTARPSTVRSSHLYCSGMMRTPTPAATLTQAVLMVVGRK